MKKNKQVYLNSKQLTFVQAKQDTRVWIGGRGTGKSSCIGVSTDNKARALPRAKGFFSSSTFSQILTKTLPAVEHMWKLHGWKEHINKDNPGHYVVGRRPPSHWVKPYQAPRKFENVITFFHGFTIELLSMDRPDLSRGGTYDFGEIDEAALVKKEDMDTVLLPSIRGNTSRFNHWSHQQISLYSTVPWKSTGYYLFDYEDKAKAEPDKNFFIESTSFDNIKIIGAKSLARMEREMDYLTAQVELHNRRYMKTPLAFYNKFNDRHHIYNPSREYGLGHRGVTFEGYNDVDKTAWIDLSFDFGAWFKCITMWQEKGNTEYLKRAYFKKENQNIDALVHSFCDDNEDHENKHVRLWGEPHGNKIRDEGETLFERVIRILNSRGWSAENCVQQSSADDHTIRRDVVNEFLEESNDRLPRIRINQEKCKSVVISLNSTEAKPDGRKNKKDEKNRSFNQEHATHFTDTVDYYLCQKHGYKVGTDMYDQTGSAGFF